MPTLYTPTDREEFDRFIPDEATAEDIFIQLRWPDGVCCPRCGSFALSWLEKRARWDCRDCDLQPSVRSWTTLHGTRKPLRDLLFMAWRSVRPSGASARGLAGELSYRYETMFDLLHKMRAALAHLWVRQLESGPVQVGAAEIPAPKRAKGDPKGHPRVLVAIAAEEAPAPPPPPPPSGSRSGGRWRRERRISSPGRARNTSRAAWRPA